MKENNIKKIMITVNGKPLGTELWVDKVTYAPVNKESAVYVGRSAATDAAAG